MDKTCTIPEQEAQDPVDAMNTTLSSYNQQMSCFNPYGRSDTNMLQGTRLKRLHREFTASADHERKMLLSIEARRIGISKIVQHILTIVREGNTKQQRAVIEKAERNLRQYHRIDVWKHVQQAVISKLMELIEDKELANDQASDIIRLGNLAHQKPSNHLSA